MNAGGLLARMNFAVNLANNRVAGVKTGAAQALETGGGDTGIRLGAPEFQRR